MTDQEKLALASQIGAETATKIAEASKKVDETAKAIAEKIVAEKTNGLISKEDFETYKTQTTELVEAVKAASVKQGVKIEEMALASNEAAKGEDLSEFMNKNANKLKSNDKFDFMIFANKEGKIQCREIEKTTNGGMAFKGPHATIDAVGAVGNVSSIFQSMSAASILRSVDNAPFEANYRNSTWLFPYIGLQQVGIGNRVAFWMDEEPVIGGPTTVAEGDLKPSTQYGARLRSADYKKEAVTLELTEEFELDFLYLANLFLGQAKVDLFNKINNDVYTRLLAAATTYTAGNATDFKTANGGIVANANNYDVMVALAAQANKNTFNGTTNAAIMSTFKAAAIGITKDTQGRYLQKPEYLANVGMIENAAVGNDDLILGDLSQYKMQLRGGMIVRSGYAGNNLIENKRTFVLEQFYFDYISARRTPAIMKGGTFAAVKALISA